jgi:translation initiation factor eIF-2B subunit alpha/methylthioribose-1-phosphate isomerase
MDNSKVFMINQPLLPHKFEIANFARYKDVYKAIKDMVVRGAPAIGATGAYGLALAALEFKGNFENSLSYISEAKKLLASARPTAYDLFDGLDFVFHKIKKSKSIEEAEENALKASQEYADRGVERCRKIGEYGAKLIKDGFRILTHCNAGWLACVDWGTALSPVYFAKREGKQMFIFVDETRPRLQGARLTAWELSQEKIPHSIVADNAAGYYMRRKEIDLVIVGADRVARNGDLANKIGTYEKAVLAKENGIPFYVATPTSTIDWKCSDGDCIPIEERNEEEVLYVRGMGDNGEIKKVRIAPHDSRAKNPSFDITPAEFITSFITEKGIFKPSELNKVK